MPSSKDDSNNQSCTTTGALILKPIPPSSSSSSSFIDIPRRRKTAVETPPSVYHHKDTLEATASATSSSSSLSTNNNNAGCGGSHLSTSIVSTVGTRPKRRIPPLATKEVGGAVEMAATVPKAALVSKRRRTAAVAATAVASAGSNELTKIKGEFVAKAQNIETSSTAEPSSAVLNSNPGVFVISSSDVSSAILELLVYRQNIIEDFLGVAERIMFPPPPGNGGFDELFYTWIVGESGPSYIEAFTESERQERRLELKYAAASKRASHAAAMAHLAGTEFTSPQEIVNSSIVQPSAAALIPASNEKKRKKDNSRGNEAKVENASKIENSDDWISSWIAKDKAARRITTLESNADQLSFLQSKVVRVSALAEWTPWEIGMFELSLAKYGQHFDKVSKAVGRKSYKECYNFYTEIFKQSNRYVAFKAHKKHAQWYGV